MVCSGHGSNSRLVERILWNLEACDAVGSRIYRMSRMDKCGGWRGLEDAAVLHIASGLHRAKRRRFPASIANMALPSSRSAAGNFQRGPVRRWGDSRRGI